MSFKNKQRACSICVGVDGFHWHVSESAAKDHAEVQELAEKQPFCSEPTPTRHTIPMYIEFFKHEMAKRGVTVLVHNELN